MNISGECEFCIYGEKLDFDTINKEMALAPVKIIHKGQCIVADKYANRDLWAYKEKLVDGTDFLDIIKSVVSKIISKKDYIRMLKLENDVKINCYIRSDFGQIGFCLDPDAIRMISDLAIEVDFHILSFGMVE